MRCVLHRTLLLHYRPGNYQPQSVRAVGSHHARRTARVYGNLFIGLVGPPGSGKTNAIREARSVAEAVGVRVGPADVYGERIIELIRDKKEEDADYVASEGKGVMALFLDEWNSLMHSGIAPTTKQMLCQLYDCVSEYKRETYTHGTQVATDTCLNLIGGCTPAHLHKFFAPLEWSEGLPSRLLLVYGERPPFREEGYRRGDMRALTKEASELVQFCAIHERIGWEPDAAEDFKQWSIKQWHEKASNHLLEGFVPRKSISVAKLAMLQAVSRQSTLISQSDLQEAKAVLSSLEKELPKALALSGGNETRDVEQYLKQFLAAEREVPEYVVRRMIGLRVNHGQISSIIEELVAQRVLVPCSPHSPPNRKFKGGRFED